MLILVVVAFSVGCFSPNPSAEDLGTESATGPGSSGGLSTTGESSASTSTSAATSTTASSGVFESSSETQGASGETSSESGDVAQTGSVSVVNAVVGGPAVDVCIAGAEPECTGDLEGLDSVFLEGVPLGPTEVTVSTVTGEMETRLITFSEEDSFAGVVAAGVDGAIRVRAQGVSLDSISTGGRVVVNALAGRTPVGIPGVGEVPPWSAVELDGSTSPGRQVVDTGTHRVGVTSSDLLEPWAFVFVGDPALHPREEASVGAHLVGVDAAEFQQQDAVVQFAAPIVPSLVNPNVVCVGDSVVATAIQRLELEPPVPLPPGSSVVSLREGMDCGGDIIVSDSLLAVRATRSLVSFGFASSLSVYQDDFSEPSFSTEYRVLNLGTDGSHLWLELRDGTNDETLEVLVADLPPNQESGAFSLDEDDTLPGSSTYFLSSGDSPVSNDAEWGFDHDPGNRAWVVTNDLEFYVIDTRTFPWEADEV